MKNKRKRTGRGERSAGMQAVALEQRFTVTVLSVSAKERIFSSSSLRSD
jgi:hypothetical protein